MSKYEPEKTPYLDTFHAVRSRFNVRGGQKIAYSIIYNIEQIDQNIFTTV